jgi:uncharacterized protein YoxC
MTGSLTTTNVWLGIIAGVSLVELLVVVTVAFLAFRLYKRAMSVVDRVEQDYVVPLNAKANAVIAEAQAVVARARGLEERVRGMVARVDDTASRVASVAQHVWPVVGTWRAVTAALGSLRHHNAERRRRAA